MIFKVGNKYGTICEYIHVWLYVKYVLNYIYMGVHKKGVSNVKCTVVQYRHIQSSTFYPLVPYPVLFVLLYSYHNAFLYYNGIFNPVVSRNIYTNIVKI